MGNGITIPITILLHFWPHTRATLPRICITCIYYQSNLSRVLSSFFVPQQIPGGGCAHMQGAAPHTAPRLSTVGQTFKCVFWTWLCRLNLWFWWESSWLVWSAYIYIMARCSAMIWIAMAFAKHTGNRSHALVGGTQPAVASKSIGQDTAQALVPHRHCIHKPQLGMAQPPNHIPAYSLVIHINIHPHFNIWLPLKLLELDCVVSVPAGFMTLIITHPLYPRLTFKTGVLDLPPHFPLSQTLAGMARRGEGGKRGGDGTVLFPHRP